MQSVQLDLPGHHCLGILSATSKENAACAPEETLPSSLASPPTEQLPERGGWGGTTQAKAAALLQASLSTKVLVSGLEPCLEDKQTESWQRSREGFWETREQPLNI